MFDNNGGGREDSHYASLKTTKQPQQKVRVVHGDENTLFKYEILSFADFLFLVFF